MRSAICALHANCASVQLEVEHIARPFLIIVTGCPGSGKTTLAGELARAARLPLVSRDAIKEGWVRTAGWPHDELPPDANLRATELFFRSVECLVDGGASLVAEAAFQHAVWAARVEPLLSRARVRVCVCEPGGPATAYARFVARAQADPLREYYHGAPPRMAPGINPMAAWLDYQPPRLNAPTFIVDTTDGYSPNIDQLLSELLTGD